MRIVTKYSELNHTKDESREKMAQRRGVKRATVEARIRPKAISRLRMGATSESMKKASTS